MKESQIIHRSYTTFTFPLLQGRRVSPCASLPPPSEVLAGGSPAAASPARTRPLPAAPSTQGGRNSALAGVRALRV